MRLDIHISQYNQNITRAHAKNLIELGLVFVNGKTALKPSRDITENDIVTISGDYSSSLGSLKLQKAIDEFKPEVFDKVCLDLGAANGGFTDILIKNGAKNVVALDVGECALSDELKKNPKVIIKDKTNARFISKEDFDREIEFIVGDLSFISLKLILPVAYKVLKEKGYAIFLIKPQFETEKKKISKGGILKDKKEQEKIVSDIKLCAEKQGFKCLGITESPQFFLKKNLEFLIYLFKK